MRSRRLPFLILVADVLWIPLALYLAYLCRHGVGINLEALRGCFTQFGETGIAAIVIWGFLTLVMKLDGFNGGWSFRAVLADLFVGVFLLLVLLLANGYLTRAYESRLVFFYFGILAIGGFLALRCVIRHILSSRRFSISLRRIVILGGGRIARELATTITCHPEMCWQVVGFLCPDSDAHGIVQGDPEASRRVRTLDVSGFLADYQVDGIIVAMANPSRQTLELVARCQRSGIRVLAVPPAYELYVSRPVLAELDGLPLIVLEQYALPAGGQALRHLTDLAVMPLLLVAGIPLLLAAAVVLALRKGKVFRKELRCGKEGRNFWMYRLNVNRDLPVLPAYEKLFVDLGLTELPQLWNVLRGDMNLVGPRPESPERVKHYSDWQRQRLKITPGITGLAQIHGLRDQHSAEQKTHYDLQYILRWSPFLDFSLVLQTLWILVARIGKPGRWEPLRGRSGWSAKAETPAEEIAYVDHS